MTACHGDEERPAVGLGWGRVVESEITQAVVDERAAEIPRSKLNVGVRADHDVRARLDERLGERLLDRVRA